MCTEFNCSNVHREPLLIILPVTAIRQSEWVEVQLNKFFAKCKSEAGWDAGGSKSFMSIWTEMQVLQKQSRFIIYLRYLRHTNQLTELNLIGCRKFANHQK